MSVSTKDFRKNLEIELDGEPYIITKAKHVKPGKGVAFVKTTIKNLLTGHTRQKNFRSGDTVERADVESKEMQYLYKEETHYIFMDEETYEQVRVDEERMEDVLDYLKENMTFNIVFWEDRAIRVEPPTFVELEVTHTPPGVRGDTAQGGTKTATLETGAEVDVPLYLESGETIKVDTRSGEYVERV
jgi:elongation factor P